MKKSLVWLMAVSSGLAVANLYYNQPLLADMGRTFYAGAGQIGLVSMLTQIGYAAGLFMFIPLGDIKERRSLIAALLVAVGVSLIGAAAAQNLPWLYTASFAIGFTTVAPQMILPMAAHLAPPEERGKIIGSIMSGLLIGILLARTVSGFMGELFGWRAMFGIASVLMFGLAYILWKQLPRSYPEISLSYGALVRSLGTLVKEQRTLREASLISAFLFGAFSVFWTSLTFLLEGPHFGFGSGVAGTFGLVGVVGAGAASVVGRLTDRINPRMMAGLAMIPALVSYLLFWGTGYTIWGLVAGVVLLDLGVQGVQISNQARIYSMLPEARSRLNTVFMVSCFLGGAAGSALGSRAWAVWGWNGVCLAGGSLAALAFVVWALHRIIPETVKHSAAE